MLRVAGPDEPPAGGVGDICIPVGDNSRGAWPIQPIAGPSRRYC